MGRTGRNAALAAFLVLSPCFAEAREVAVPGPTELEAALQAAQGGDVLRLSGGDWGPLDLRGLAWPDDAPVTLAAADPSDPPVFSELRLRDVENLDLDGFVVDYTFTDGDPRHLPVASIEDSRGIGIRGALFDGDTAQGAEPADNGFPTAIGLRVQNSSGVTVEGSEVRTFHRGFVFGRSQDIAIRNNDVHGIRSDGMNFAQVERVRIEGNHIHDFARSPASKDHADMIQFWTKDTEVPSRDIVIRGNLLNSGDGLYTQSIFLRNDMVDRGLAGPEMFYRNVTIEGNLIINAHLHGITMGETDGLHILNNTVVRNPESEGPADNPGLWTPQIRVSAASEGVQIARNIVDSIVGPEERPDWTVEDNLLVQDRGRLEPGHYSTVFVGGDPADPASFAPLKGGPLDGADLGASLALGSR